MKSKGFTLIELLVYISIFSVVFAIIISFVTWAYQTNIRSAVQRELSEDIRNVMNVMSKEIRQAKNIYNPLSTETQLSLRVLGNLPQGESYSYIDFFLCENRVCLKKESQNPIALTSEKTEVNKLKFTIVNSDSVQIFLSLKRKNSFAVLGEYSFTEATSTVFLRLYE